MRRKRFAVCLLTMLTAVVTMAGNLDDIRQALEESSYSQVQEKVYIHTDNGCYFVGDTLWYKAYVVRADDLLPTDISRILYVELLSPDGLLVERQQIVVSNKGHMCGQFVLTDSLYSGYYELRAYTRWMLNFNVRHHRFSTTDKWAFYNKQMAADYYRIWDGLYSRVFPVYSKPDEAGDFEYRRMYQRPKTRIQKPKKEDLFVSFYPEGGHLIEGVENNVAFEVTNQLGEAVTLKGTVTGAETPLTIQTEYMGRGSFIVKPDSRRLKASFNYHGKAYSFNLPHAEKKGFAVRLADGKVTLSSHGLPQDASYGMSVLCRGALKHFETFSAGSNTIQLPLNSLPTGVNQLTLFDDEGQILADRLFFVNHHEHDSLLITAPIESTRTYEPYELVELPVQCQGVTEPTAFSLSIQDRTTDEPTYDDGNLMTSMLLSSDLKGFIARPAYYFEKDDDSHRRHLDLLMQVQGWRKYKWQELADTARQLRYTPETALTVEGHVYKMISINEIDPDEISSWLTGTAMIGQKKSDDEEATEDPWADVETSEFETIGVETSTESNVDVSTIETGSFDTATADLRAYGGSLRKDVFVEAEVSVGKQVVGSVQKTNRGHFLFQVPPFYGTAYLNMKAYKEKDSLKKSMTSRQDKKVLDEDSYPDYYVKRDLFYPIFTHEYTYYEKHQPDLDEEQLIDTLSELSMENEVQQLGNVTVKGRRRGRRAIDWKKPAFVIDAYQMYNDLTDYGLSYGKLDMRLFPIQVCRFLYGNMNRHRMFNVDGRLEGYTYYRNYSPYSFGSEVEVAGLLRANRTPQWYVNRLKMKRMQDIRVFSDYEPRNEDSTMVESMTSADATVDIVLIPDDGIQPTFRDRHLVFKGFNAPEAFYQPDYSERKPEQPTDYRRTLYWNPNAVTDEQGRFVATFYNNSKQTRIKMTAAGLTNDGLMMHGSVR